jgi:hypothetical protein
MTTRDKVSAIINAHAETLKPIYVLLAEQSLTRKAFYQCLKDEPELADQYKEVQKQVSWIRKRIQIDKLERRLEAIAHGRGKQLQTKTIRDADGKIIQTETIETIKAPSETAIKFLLDRYDLNARRADEPRLFGLDAVNDDDDLDDNTDFPQTIFNVVTRPK